MIKSILVVFAVALGAWLIFDGAKALRTGDYTTPGSGAHAGQLGPWARAVSAVGLEPRGTFVKWAHVAVGSLWLVGAILLFLAPSLARVVLIVCSLGSLWYLPFGTIIGVAELVLLLAPAIRRM